MNRSAGDKDSILDGRKAGECLRAARAYAGIATVEEAAATVLETTGLDLGPQRLSDLEVLGDSLTFEEACALMDAYRTPGGVAFLFDALPEAMAAKLKRAEWPFPARKRKDS